MVGCRVGNYSLLWALTGLAKEHDFTGVDVDFYHDSGISVTFTSFDGQSDRTFIAKKLEDIYERAEKSFAKRP